jgi:hypothetical protein
MEKVPQKTPQSQAGRATIKTHAPARLPRALSSPPVCGVGRLHARAVFQGRRRGHHRGYCGFAAGHGLRHCLGPQARGRHLDRHHRRRADLGAGRLGGADRRAGRRLHRDRLRHPGALRPGQPADRHRLRRRAALPAGVFQAGHAGALCAGEHRGGFYQRHRGADRAVAGQGFAGPGRAQDAGRFFLADQGPGRPPGQLQPLRAGPGAGLPAGPVCLAAPLQPAGARRQRFHHSADEAGAGGRGRAAQARHARPRACPAPSWRW